MSYLLKFDPDACEQAEIRCDQLAETIDGVYTDLCSLHNQLQANIAGQTADSFGSFVEGPAKANVYQLADMCRQTAGALRHTRQEFLNADQALSQTFRV